MNDKNISDAIHLIKDFREDVKSLTLTTRNVLDILKEQISSTHAHLMPVLENLELRMGEVDKYFQK